MDRGGTPRTRDLRDLALGALKDQGITTWRLRWMGQHASRTFRCDTADGERLLIRVCLPGVRTDAELDAELIWLAALTRDTNLTVPVARFSIHVATPQLPGGGRCIGFSWIEGRRCRYPPSRRLVADLGRVLATLHSHAQGFRPPPGFTRPELDLQRLTWAGTWHADRLATRTIDPATRRLLGEATRQVEEVLARLGRDPAGYGLIHADLHLDNVVEHYGQARPIDFEDTSWGHYALDLAITVASIPDPLHPVLLGGYQAVRPLPPGYEEHRAALLAACHLYLAIWYLANGLPDDEGHLDQLKALTRR